MHRARYDSLLDDPFFSMELERVDLPVDRDLVAVEANPAAREIFTQQLGPAVGNDVIEEKAPDGWMPIELAGFLVMMTVGGAAAAWLFADRVAWLVR
jgi:hypothetical protein